jgi:hypothetical protein
MSFDTPSPHHVERHTPKTEIRRELGWDETGGMHTLYYGSKKLELRIGKSNDGHWDTETMLTTESTPKVEHETTVLYQEVANILTELASDSQCEVKYGFGTADPNMINWALTTGNEIFNWENIKHGENRHKKPTIDCNATLLPV